ncbi:hypothetical protein COT99_00295 [Candidatus Falkowbacteria bacterium CG10_big_fil_rev_8_21_14_0_10_43_10]|uniref:Uncharacterized protein n=1 Tax=Candidatus Falkowbacteria bacterium CG10_big_fil_rev_8_21_14_0_10_43_10 TaxID=1974567 RepID=A0A2H0V353_9BACT|nr:MAG: hypothetical protein COT99_00295 [Candidatus Falkowbacteria bacterium CG10_big_fil_rev_8_21_14_0_10_43_10]
MSLQDLPKPGSKFRAKIFSEKMKRATRYGELKSLSDNIDPIVETIREYQSAVRRKGGLNSLQRRSALGKIKKKSSEQGIAVTAPDVRGIKKILEHFNPKNKNTTAGLADKYSSSAKADKGLDLFKFRREEKKPPVARYLRALDRSYEDEKNNSSTGVSIESIRNKGGASRLRVDISKGGSRQSGINPLTGGTTSSKQANGHDFSGRLDVNPLSGGTTRPVGGGLNQPSAPTPPKLPPKLAI